MNCKNCGIECELEFCPTCYAECVTEGLGQSDEFKDMVANMMTAMDILMALPPERRPKAGRLDDLLNGNIV